MKKLLALALCAVMAVSMAACGKKDDVPETFTAEDIQKMIESGEITVITDADLLGAPAEDWEPYIHQFSEQSCSYS